MFIVLNVLHGSYRLLINAIASVKNVFSLQKTIYFEENNNV